jgi:hypothetical protein
VILPGYADNSGVARNRRAKHYVIGQQKGHEPVRNYNAADFSTSDDVALARLEYALAEQIGPLLVKKYPKRRWSVGVDARGGMMCIVCPSVSTTKGYHIALQDPRSKMARTLTELADLAVRAAGEILERHGVTRGVHINLDHLEALPRTVKDDVIAADAAPEPAIKRIY